MDCTFILQLKTLKLPPELAWEELQRTVKQKRKSALKIIEKIESIIKLIL